MPGCWRSFPTSRPPAGPFSNGSRARPCRGWPPSRRADEANTLPGEPLAVLVHDRLEAEAALGLGVAAERAVELVIPVGIAGPAFARALQDRLGQQVTAWCDDLPGLALEALRVGLTRIVLEPVTAADALAAARLGDLAARAGAELRTALPRPLFRLDPKGRRLLPAALGTTTASVP